MEITIPSSIVTVAYRFYVATYEYMIESLLEELDGIGERYHEIKLEVGNDTLPEVSVFYTLDVDDDDHIEVSYCLEFSPEFDRRWVIFREARQELTTPKMMHAHLKQLCETSIRLCKCGREVGFRGKTDILGDKCLECFMYSTKRTDDDVCPVCLEDEGLWVQLVCGHILHKHCFWKLQKPNVRCLHSAQKPCPVCRQKTTRLQAFYYELKLEQHDQ